MGSVAVRREPPQLGLTERHREVDTRQLVLLVVDSAHAVEAEITSVLDVVDRQGRNRRQRRRNHPASRLGVQHSELEQVPTGAQVAQHHVGAERCL
jgi:hypothetical protein